MDEREDAARSLLLGLRKAFHAISALGEAVHQGSGITLGMRGVMESLFRQGPATVPALARSRPVSRQHIQALVGRLLELGLVEALANPAHRRSVLIALSDKGAKVFAALERREKAPLARLFDGMRPEDVARTGRILEGLHGRALGLARGLARRKRR
ncbi:MAG: MarR family transcriptional regulator [Alphaproteobacteria bacterium]|nr:MarR family transcriptional regulator [Alphaproteobacteria bacterium]